MDLDLDKEIDAMLRGAGQNGAVSGTVSTPHLDADGISAFAENALPSRTRSAYMLHLADCGDCRIILKNTIEMNAASGPEPEIIYAPAIKRSNTPWYRRLSLFPNLAYAMGGLIVLFAGFIGYSVFLNGGGSMELSRSGEQYPAAYESSNTAAAATESGAAPMTSSAANTANASANVSPARSEDVPVNANSSIESGSPKPTPRMFEAANEESDAADQIPEVAAAPPPIAPAKPSGQENYSKDVIITVPRQDDESRVAAATPRDRSERPTEAGRLGAAARESKAKSASSAATRTVGGKRFERKQRVWYDSAYSGQATSNIKRGSDSYRTLDRSLRTIAESLDGTVVVVWGGKAYRIQ